MSNIQMLATQISESLKSRGETIAVAESSSGGLVSAALLEVPGASAYFMGGVVVYTRPAKTELLGVSEADLDEFRSASEPHAMILARTVRERLNTDWGLAETGAAGPGGNRYGDAAGHVCVAIAGPTELVKTVETGLSDRSRNMELFTEEALGLAMATLKNS